MESQQRSILNYIKSCQNRAFRHTVYQQVIRLLFIAMCLLAMFYIGTRFFILPFSTLILSLFLILGAVGFGFLMGMIQRKTSSEIANSIDTNMRLKGRVITSLESIKNNKTDEIAYLQMCDSTSRIENLGVSEFMRFTPPKFVKWLPIPLLLIGLSFAIPQQYELPEPIAVSERDAINQTIAKLINESHSIKNTHIQNEITKTVNQLKNTNFITNVQESLSELNREIQKQKSEYPDVSAITAAVKTTQHFKNMDTTALAEEFERLAAQKQLTPELLSELQKLFSRLSENDPNSELKQKLDQIQGTTVPSDVLLEIANALKHANRLNQLEDMLVENRKQIALASIKTNHHSGGMAHSDGSHGQETGNTEVQGSQETNTNSDFTPTSNGITSTENENNPLKPLTDGNVPRLNNDGNALEIITENESDSEIITRVFTGRVNNDANEPNYLPFSKVVLATQQDYENAIENNRIPARYRNRIKAYLKAIVNINEKQTD